LQRKNPSKETQKPHTRNKISQKIGKKTLKNNTLKKDQTYLHAMQNHHFQLSVTQLHHNSQNFECKSTRNRG
jgi:hypothetical protein